MTVSWHELLGVPKGTRAPDLYEVLGLSRSRFDAGLVERAFAERMQRLDARRDPREKPIVDRAKEELLRARRVLKSPEARAIYEEDLAKKAAKVERKKTAKVATPMVEPPPTRGFPRPKKVEKAADKTEKSGKASKTATPKPPPPTTLDPPRPKELERAERSPDRSANQKPTRADEQSSGPTPRPKTTSTSLVGRTIDDKYEILDQLGEGGMGMVYKARHKLLDKLVALKVLNPDLAFRETIRERFFREARAAMEFVHPNAVPLRDFGHTKDGLLYMTQDYSPGRSLRAILDSSGRLEPPRALGLVRQCLLALGEAHRKGIVHRDVKPENILVERDSSPGSTAYVARVCDFGIAKIVDTEGTEGGLTGGAVIGTPHYMAPEQAAGDSVDARADIYAIACVLYETLTGQRVFDAETSMQVIMMQVTQKPDPPTKHIPSLGRAIDALVLRGLGKTPQSRFQTAEEFVQAIDLVLQKLASGSAASSGSDIVTRSASRRAGGASSSGLGSPAESQSRRMRGLNFCDGCNASLPEDWVETRQGRKVGNRTLCLTCYAPIKAGKTCLGCLTPLKPGVKTVPAGKSKRLCESCASKGEYLRVCAGCEVLLPFVAFQRGEAFAKAGKFYCKDCHRRGG